jgi:hypothetical protein
MTLNPPLSVALPDEKPDSVACLPYVRSIVNRIIREISEHITKSVALPPREVSNLFRPVKDDLGLKRVWPGVHRADGAVRLTTLVATVRGYQLGAQLTHMQGSH